LASSKSYGSGAVLLAAWIALSAVDFTSVADFTSESRQNYQVA
jgi:hypothetical protein